METLEKAQSSITSHISQTPPEKGGEKVCPTGVTRMVWMT